MVSNVKSMPPRKKARAKRALPALDEMGAVSLSEDALALQFAREHHPRFKWTPGMGWMHNLGTHWVADDRLDRFATVRMLCRDAAASAEDAREAKRLSSAKTVAAVVSLAQSDSSLVLPSSAWDADALALNTPDSLVDLRTGATRARHRDFLTQVTRVAPSDAECPAWKRFIDAVFLGDLEMVEFVQRLLGYLLTADRSEQKLFFFFGLGANGKSTLIDLVSWILGTYAIKLPATVLMQSSIDRHPTELAQLRGKRLAVSSELDEGQFWAESRLKELTGDEVLTARFMRQDFFEFHMTQTHVIVGNYKPRLRGGDAALARRFVLVPFKAKFEGSARDPAMLAKLRAEAPAILAWMIAGAVKWCDSGLAIPASVTAASREYLADNDDVSLWLAECCQMLADSRARAIDLYESFAHWIKSRGQHTPSMRLFGDRMSVLPGITKVQSNGARYVGIRLTVDEAERQLSERRGAIR
jgi:putative DNA primase/helicase